MWGSIPVILTNKVVFFTTASIKASSYYNFTDPGDLFFALFAICPLIFVTNDQSAGKRSDVMKYLKCTQNKWMLK